MGGGERSTSQSYQFKYGHPPDEDIGQPLKLALDEIANLVIAGLAVHLQTLQDRCLRHVIVNP